MWLTKTTKSIKLLQLHNNLLIYSFTTASSSQSSSAKTTKAIKKTLYQILEIPSSASIANIKQNYLKLAKIYHPDVYKGKDKDRFAKIQQAYKILSDRVKRSKYDQQIGNIKRNTQEKQQTTQKSSAADNIQTGKPKNPMSYQMPNTQQLNLQQQFNKFFNQKTKTQFQQIRLNQQPQIRAMSQAQRIRRHFSQVYQSADRMAKSTYQKQFGSILNDQINQQNRMFDENLQNQKKFVEINKLKNIKKMRNILLIGFILFGMVTTPFIISFITKYNLDKQKQKQVDQAIKDVQNKIQEQMLRARFKYQ